MRPIFVGNFEFDTRQSELERFFSKYGRIERVDMKSGYAFVYFEDERDAADAIRGTDNMPFGYERRRLSVEWAKGERGRHHDGPKSGGNQRPTKTLFVINFDPIRTRFENQEEATRALECTHMSKVLDRVVSVEYALKDDDERGDKYNSPRRDYGRQRDSPYQRSPSPVYRRNRPSPDYGRPRSPVHNGPSYDRYRSPQYGRYRSRSPVRRS
ncbi:hypothetical protein MTR67_042570 [Solanum verrucosum]|uniref:RRM domain-containing protein n=1 Tax=Solanum verrucosum TaxID=315347 RepID=A0AAF0UNQ0_SOLVR|nr:hypothetical protein MTR67_042570 [Solanum verrucosum]